MRIGWCIRYSGCRLRTTNDPSYTTYQLESGEPSQGQTAELPGGAPFVEGPGTIAVSVDGREWSNEYRIAYANLFSVALGRRPYISEPEGHLVFTSDESMWSPGSDRNNLLTVEASLPSVSKNWTWPNVTVGTDVLLPLDFDGLPARLHNDMAISVTIHSGSATPDEKLTVWRRFMRVPSQPAGSRVEAVQLDATRGGILVGGKPFLGRGYYINRLNNNKSAPAVRTFPLITINYSNKPNQANFFCRATAFLLESPPRFGG